MENNIVKKKSSIKKQLFVTIYNRLDSALSEYKDYLDEKSTRDCLKKPSKVIAGRIVKSMEKAKAHQWKMEKKATKESKNKAI